MKRRADAVTSGCGRNKKIKKYLIGKLSGQTDAMR